MRTKRLLSLIFCATGMLLLILDAKTALYAASEGISLCITVVIPSLFPLLVLSTMINTTLSGLKSPVLRPISKLCRIPEGAEPVLLLGLLGGYPVGAAGVRQAYDSGVLKKVEAERMLAFCNNAGPAFIFGILSLQFEGVGVCLAIWVVQIVSSLVVSMIVPGCDQRKTTAPVREPITMPQAIPIGLRNMANVCGWVIVFRVIIGFLERWLLWLLPQRLSLIVLALLELTNGCLLLSNIEQQATRFLIASAFLALGGICVAMQTASVSGTLSLRKYYIGKLLQAVISVVLSALLLLIFPLA